MEGIRGFLEEDRGLEDNCRRGFRFPTAAEKAICSWDPARAWLKDVEARVLYVFLNFGGKTLTPAYDFVCRDEDKCVCGVGGEIALEDNNVEGVGGEARPRCLGGRPHTPLTRISTLSSEVSVDGCESSLALSSRASLSELSITL